MTSKHWFKMLASALLVFVIGLAITRGVSAGGRSLGNLIGEHTISVHTADISVPVSGLAFRLNDAQLGTLQHLSIVRRGPADVRGLDFVVKLDKGVSADQFAGCELTVSTPSKIDKDTKFQCLADGVPGYDELVQFGTITFLSPGLRTQRHRFEVPQSFVDALHDASEAAVANTGATNLASASQGDDHFQVMMNGQKVVEINGSDVGGSVVIRDPATGKSLVDIHGDSSGGNVVIRDGSGKSLLEINGTDAGGTVKVNGVTKATATAATVHGNMTVKIDSKAPAKP